jgi:hypothetical protein
VLTSQEVVSFIKEVRVRIKEVRVTMKEVRMRIRIRVRVKAKKWFVGCVNLSGGDDLHERV